MIHARDADVHARGWRRNIVLIRQTGDHQRYRVARVDRMQSVDRDARGVNRGGDRNRIENFVQAAVSSVLFGNDDRAPRRPPYGITRQQARDDRRGIRRRRPREINPLNREPTT